MLLSADCCNKEYLFDSSIDENGIFSLNPVVIASGGHELREVFRLTPQVSLLAAGSGIRKHVNGTYNPSFLVQGQEIWRLSRMGDWIYWTEGFSHIPSVNLPRKVARAKVDCNGNLATPQYMSFDHVGMAAVGCPDTGRVYVAGNNISDPLFEGFLSVFDSKECTEELALCTPKKFATRKEIPSLGSQPNMMAISPDCSALYVASVDLKAPVVSVLNVFSLANPDAPVFVQSIEGGKTYDGVALEQGGAPWAVAATREAVYWTFSFATGIAVLKPVP
jgi:hypothetical protein